MSLNNFRIGTRLSAAFAIILALMVVVSMVGLQRLSQLNASLAHIVNERVAKVDLITGIAADSGSIAQGLRDIIQGDPQLHYDHSRSALLQGTGIEDWFNYAHGCARPAPCSVMQWRWIRLFPRQN